MSDYGALSTNGVGAGMKKDAFADAVQRARQVMLVRPQMETTGEQSRMVRRSSTVSYLTS